MRLIRFLAATFIITAIGAGVGCVERKERLVISPDGSVLWQVNMRSDTLEDLLTGDAVPTPGALWIVRQEQERDEEGRVTHILNAETAFAPRRKLPQGFGRPQSIEEQTCLAFPTTITFEKRRDGTYCHFTRRYEARAWREIETLREQYVENVAGGLVDDPAAWTPVQRLNITQALVRFEIEKHIHFTRQAWLATLPDEPQDGYLKVADSLRSIMLTMDFARLSNLLAPPEEGGQIPEGAIEQAIKIESEQLQATIIAKLQEAAQQAGLEGSKANALLAACETQRRIFAATEDLNDDGFEIEVEMPGVIVASNAEQVDGGVSGNTILWKFKGESLHDNAIELIATSKIAR